MAEGLIGNYRIGRKLGEGGMGTVYLAEHTLLGRKAALKVLLPALSANPDIVNRFFNEARSATAIADPGIVQIFDFGIHTDGSAYIVMELLEGEPLDQRLHRVGRLAAPDALRIIRQAAVSRRIGGVVDGVDIDSLAFEGRWLNMGRDGGASVRSVQWRAPWLQRMNQSVPLRDTVETWRLYRMRRGAAQRCRPPRP